MSRLRWRLLLAMTALSVVLAYLLRDVVYDMVIVPLSYLLWLGKLYYSAIPQWVIWSLLLGLLFVAVFWSLIPDVKPSVRQEPKYRRTEGKVEALVVWMTKARHGNYFKWQLANRLGRIARGLNEPSGARSSFQSDDDAVNKYLDAGLNYSFVDFPSARSRFERAPRTPLDLDPSNVVDYLESQMESTSGRRG